MGMSSSYHDDTLLLWQYCVAIMSSSTMAIPCCHGNRRLSSLIRPTSSVKLDTEVWLKSQETQCCVCAVYTNHGQVPPCWQGTPTNTPLITANSAYLSHVHHVTMATGVNICTSIITTISANVAIVWPPSHQPLGAWAGKRGSLAAVMISSHLFDQSDVTGRSW